MIEKLTPEQEAKLPEYVKKWISIGLNTDPTDFKEAIIAAKESYVLAGIPAPKVFLGPFNTPIEGVLAYKAFSELVGKSFGTLETTPEQDSELVNDYIKQTVAEQIKTYTKSTVDLSAYIFGSQEYWLSFYDFLKTECGLEICKQLDGLQHMSKVCGWWIPMTNCAIFCERPSEIHFDEQNRTHNLNGPAIKFRGEYRGGDVYIIHGIRVDKSIIDRTYSVTDIDKHENIEVRRVMIDLYGNEKYIVDSGAKAINTDDFGTLYRKEVPNDEPVVMVKVLNSTPEPDGTFKDYWIRVDPNAYGGCDTAWKAVASTWRNKDGSMVFANWKDYDPDIET